MKTITTGYTLAIDRTTGKPVLNNNQHVAVTNTGANVWIPAKAELGKYITYKVHERGDTFVASKDSSRTKGEVLGDKCPQGEEGEPLYMKGDTVTRTQEFIEFVGFSENKEVQEISFEDKVAILAKYGVKMSL